MWKVMLADVQNKKRCFMVVVINDNRKRASNATSFDDEVAQVQVVERQRTIFTWKIFCFGVVEWTRSAAQEEKKVRHQRSTAIKG